MKFRIKLNFILLIKETNNYFEEYVQKKQKQIKLNINLNQKLINNLFMFRVMLL